MQLLFFVMVIFIEFKLRLCMAVYVQCFECFGTYDYIPVQATVTLQSRGGRVKWQLW